MAIFKKIEQLAVLGENARSTLELSRTVVDGKGPRLHIGRWMRGDGAHRRHTGFLTIPEARALRDALNGLEELDG